MFILFYFFFSFFRVLVAFSLSRISCALLFMQLFNINFWIFNRKRKKKCRRKNGLWQHGGIIGWKNAIYYNSPSFFCVENIIRTCYSIRLSFCSGFFPAIVRGRARKKRKKKFVRKRKKQWKMYQQKEWNGMLKENYEKNSSRMNGKTSLSAITIRI